MSYNIIPVGDHCATATILKDLNRRTCSYPFDWVADSRAEHSCIHANLSMIQDLLHTDISAIVSQFLGDAVMEGAKVNSHTHMLFQHEEGSIEEVRAKYERRFERLLQDIQTKKNLFILLTRFHVIEKEQLDTFISRMRAYNPDNRFLVISGIEHPYLNDPIYQNGLTYKYIYYNPAKKWDYDYSHFRPQIKQYLRSTIDLLVK